MRKPVDPNQLDAPTATLYRAAISLGAQETQLIWSRYTGFIVMNGFFISALTNEKVRDQSEILALLGIAALFLNCIWHILNYAGWQNQNLLYRRAANLFESDIGLLTDHFRDRNFKPVGWIYWLAQTIPTMFSLVALPCIALSLQKILGTSPQCSWSVGLALWLGATAAVFTIEYKAIAVLSSVDPA